MILARFHCLKEFVSFTVPKTDVFNRQAARKSLKLAHEDIKDKEQWQEYL